MYLLCRYHRPDDWDVRLLPNTEETIDGQGLRFRTGKFESRADGSLFHVIKTLAELQTSSEKWERDCPGKRLRINSTYEQYVARYGLSPGEYGYYRLSTPYEPGHAPSSRTVANPYCNYVVSHREWCETYPAMKWLRRTEQSFDENDIQEEYAGPDAIATYTANAGPNMSSCRQYFRFEEGDIGTPFRPIDPDGY